MPKKIVKAVEETVNETVADVTREANETVGAITFKRWQVVVAAVAVTALLLVVIF